MKKLRSEKLKFYKCRIAPFFLVIAVFNGKSQVGWVP